MSEITNPNNIIQSPLNKVHKDKFTMVLTYPPALRAIIDKTNRSNKRIIPSTLEFSVHGSVVPVVSIPAVTLRYAGQTLNITGHSREPYDKLNIKFVIDNRFNNYWVIYKWLNILNDEKQSFYDVENLSNLNITNSAELEKKYMSDFSIFGLDEYNKRTIEFKYTKAFPTKLEGIDYSYQDEGEVESSVEFAYSQFFSVLNEQVEEI